MTDTMTKVKDLIAQNPMHAVPAAREFEQLYKADPDNSGYRRIYWELQRKVDEMYPITRPEEVDPPQEAWNDENHQFWTTDPWTVWDSNYNRMRFELGFVNARMIASELQQAGQDLI